MDEIGPLPAVPVPPKRRLGRPLKYPELGPVPRKIKKTNRVGHLKKIYKGTVEKVYATRGSGEDVTSLLGPIDLENLLKKNRKRTSKPLTHNSISHMLPSLSASCDSIPLEVENTSTERDIDAEEMLDTEQNVNQTEESGRKFVTELASARIQKLEEQVEKLTNELRAFKELKTREEETAVQNANLEYCVQEMYKQNDQEQETFQFVGYENCDSAETEEDEQHEEEQPQEGTEEEYFEEIANYDSKNADDHFEIVYEDSKYDKTEADFGVEDQIEEDESKESEWGCRSCSRRR